MNPSAIPRMLTQLWFITVAVLAVTVLYLAKVLLLPLGFAILFAFLLAPVVALLERLRLPRPIAAMSVILVFSGLLCVAAWSVFTQLVAIANDLPTYGDNIAQKMRTLHSPSNSAYSRAQREIQDISEELGIANSTGALPPPASAMRIPSAAPPTTPSRSAKSAAPPDASISSAASSNPSPPRSWPLSLPSSSSFSAKTSATASSDSPAIATSPA